MFVCVYRVSKLDFLIVGRLSFISRENEVSYYGGFIVWVC